jgi:hypothetical protein
MRGPQGDSQLVRLKEVSEALSKPPCTLAFDRGEVEIPPDLNNPLGRAVLKIMGFESKRSKLLHGAAAAWDTYSVPLLASESDGVETRRLQAQLARQSVPTRC